MLAQPHLLLSKVKFFKIEDYLLLQPVLVKVLELVAVVRKRLVQPPLDLADAVVL